MPYLLDIPQPEYSTCTWDRFLDKAAKGSYKAEQTLDLAEDALIHKYTGQDPRTCTEAQHSAWLDATIPSVPPWPSFQEFLQQLIDDGLVDPDVDRSESPIHDRSHYSSLWARKVRVDGTDLVHDAALHAFQNWSRAEYDRLTDPEAPDDNSQDIVAALLLLLSTIQAHQPD